MELGEALYRSITRGAHRRGLSPATEGYSTLATFRRAVAEIARRSPSTGAAAELLGISERTWRRYRHAERIPTPSKQQGRNLATMVVRAQRRLRLTPARERELRRAHYPTVKVARLVVSSEEKGRTIDYKPHLIQSNVMDQVVDAFLAGDPIEELAAVFLAAHIGEGTWYADHLGPGSGSDIDRID